MAVWVLSLVRCSRHPKICDWWQTHWWRWRVWGNAGRALSLLYIPWHSPHTWGKIKKKPQNIPALPTWKMLGTIRFAASSASLLSQAALGLRVKQPGSKHHQRKYMQSCRTKEFPTSGKSESKFAVRALMWSAKNGTNKSSWICLLPMYQGVPVKRWKHLDCNTCSLLTWVWIGSLHMGQA
jgi:hypothetical protein